MDDGGYGEVSGDMAVPGTVGKADADEYNTLDEPVKETIVSCIIVLHLKVFCS